jgi:protein-disulfide isomerase
LKESLMARALPFAVFALALVVLTGCQATSETPPPPEAAKALSPDQQAAVRALVRDVLVNNPEILLEAQDALTKKEQAAAMTRLTAADQDFSLGPVDAKVTIVEFFDYRCPYCHAATEWVWKTAEANKDIRFVFKELPILSENSVLAARAAIASEKQGKYPQFHRALMGARGTLDMAQIERVAQSVGLDVARLKRDMDDPAVARYIDEVRATAQALNVNGTPAFFINGQMIPGFAQDRLEAAIKTARDAAG